MNSERASGFAAPESLVKLFQRWGSKKQLGPGVRSLLQEVSRRLDGGQWHVTECNVFDVMARAWKEDAHTHILAWLLNPREAHGLGERFLREFVWKGTGRPLPNGRVREVKCQRRIPPGDKRIDIEVLGEGWILAVENKIAHVETPGQTRAYADYYRKLRERGGIVLGIFLTREGKRAEASEFFHSMSYRTLRSILEQEQMRGNTAAAEVVRLFADHIRKDLEVNT